MSEEREMEANVPERPAALSEQAPPVSLDELLQVAPSPLAPGLTLAGECTDARHPTLSGRVRVVFRDGRDVHERWLPTLHRLPVREGDRVLVVQPQGFPEPVVTGVIDGFAERPRPARAERASLSLDPDEALRVHAADGTPVLEIFESETGPVVRLLTDDVDLELPGKLRLSADEIDLRARKGQVRVRASDDVVVRGEVVKLN